MKATIESEGYSRERRLLSRIGATSGKGGKYREQRQLSRTKTIIANEGKFQEWRATIEKGGELSQTNAINYRERTSTVISRVN